MDSIRRYPESRRRREAGPSTSRNMHHDLEDVVLKSIATSKARRPWTRTTLIQLFTLLWLVPVMTLLFFNLKAYYIGANAWCPLARCRLDLLSQDTFTTEVKLADSNRDSHNLLGALQLIAKTLEVWFAFIATSLVYLLTFIVAGKRNGLPIAYLTRPFEYGKLEQLFDCRLWTTAAKGPWRNRLLLIGFMTFSVMLGILSNLMGPGIGVLALPTLQWSSNTQPLGRVFHSMTAAEAPDPTSNQFNKVTSNMFGPMCSSSEKSNGKYSCSVLAAAFVDNWVTSYSAARALGADDGTISSIWRLSFAVNGSAFASQIWTPSRLALWNFAVDFMALESMAPSTPNEVSVPQADSAPLRQWNNSIQTSIVRNGPIIGAAPDVWASSYYWPTPWNVQNDEDRQIRCYPNYVPKALCDGCTTFDELQNAAFGHNFTKCIQIGSGWGGTTASANFSVPRKGRGSKNDTSLSNIHVNIYSSDTTAFLPDGNLSWLPSECLQPGLPPSNMDCDWNRLFAVDIASPLSHKSRYLNTWEYSVSNDTMSSFQTLDFVALLNFTDYQFDPSLVTNPRVLVQTPNVPQAGTAIPVHPWWALAAFAVDSNGSLPLTRTVGAALANSMYSFFETNYWAYSEDTEIAIDRQSSTFVPLWQMLSMLTYTTRDFHDAEPDTSHPALYQTVRLYGWGYGMKSRTAYLGAAVAFAGVLVCILQLVLGLIDLRPYRSLTQILVAALEHVPKGEFAAATESDREASRVCFTVKDHDLGAGKLEFRACSTAV